jgi:uncharacterized protein (DUF2141 family)
MIRTLAHCLILSLVIISCKKKKEVEPTPTNIIENPIDTTGNNQPKPEYIIIQVQNILSVEGKINVALYNSSSSFNKPNEVFKQMIVAVTSNSLELKMDSIPPGEYAFALFHDKNSDNTLNQNWLGIPTEGFAFSNNAFGTFGPPSWDQAKFTLPANSFVTQNVTLKHF